MPPKCSHWAHPAALGLVLGGRDALSLVLCMGWTGYLIGNECVACKGVLLHLLLLPQNPEIINL